MPQVIDAVDALVPTTRDIEGRDDGPLTGLTFVAKDLFTLAGHTSSFGDPTWRDTHGPSSTTSPVIGRLLEAGADLVGLAKMDQLAYSLIGNVGEGLPPRNVNAPDLYCGGSSSGSASAVAANMSDFALGTDTAGSIRVPAAACGLHSIRPSHGAIEPEGVIPLAPSLDVVGIVSRDILDLSRILGVLAPGLRASRKVRSIQFASDLFDVLDTDSKQAARALAERLAEESGVALEETSFAEFTSPDVGRFFARVQSREIWTSHSDWVTAHGGALADDVRTRLKRCESLAQDPESVNAADLAAREAYRADIERVVLPGTVVVLPVVPERGPKISWDDQKLMDFRTACFRLSAPSSLSGAPQAVLSVPVDATNNSMGIGLFTAAGGDHLLLDLMAAL